MLPVSIIQWKLYYLSAVYSDSYQLRCTRRQCSASSLYSLCSDLGSFLLSVRCPERYLLILPLRVTRLSPFLPCLPQRWCLWPSLLPCSLPCPPPAPAPLPEHLRVWQARERRQSPGAPPFAFFFPSSHLPFSHRHHPPPSVSTLFCHPLLASPAFSLKLSPFIAPVPFFLYHSFSAPPRLSPLICSSFFFMASPFLSSPWQHFPISILWSRLFFFSFFYPLFVSLFPPLTFNIKLLCPKLSSLFSLHFSRMLAITFTIFRNLSVSQDFSIYLPFSDSHLFPLVTL